MNRQTPIDLGYGDVMLRRMLAQSKELRQHQLRPPAPPTVGDLEARRAWEEQMAWRSDRLTEQREEIEYQRDQLAGLGEARIGPIEHAIIAMVSDIDDNEKPVSLSDDEQLIRETLFFPYHLSLTVNQMIREWAQVHLSDEDWRQVLRNATALEAEHRDKAEARRMSKERARQKGRA
jgi:hypothetical protein